MYNKQQKNIFLTDYASKHDFQSDRELSKMYVAMRKLSKYETKWDMDLCEQDNEECLQEIFDDCGPLSRTHMDMLFTAREYIKWCISQHVKGATDTLLNMSTPALEYVRLSTVCNPLQLHQYLSAVYRSESENTIDNIYRTFFWLAFSGLEEREAYEITTDDVDFENMCIHYKGRKFYLYKEGLPAIKDCVYAKSFVYTNHIYNTPTIDRPRVSGNLLLRGVRSTGNVDNRIIRTLTSRAQANAVKDGRTKRKLAYMRVWKSGIFYREYEGERNCNAPGFEQVAKNMLVDGARAYRDDEATYEQKRQRILYQLDRDYKQWRVAHNL